MTDWATHESRLQHLEAFMRRQERKCTPAPPPNTGYEYALVCEHTADYFDAEVNYRLQHGWHPHGHMVINQHSGFYCMGMIRYPQREE